MEQPILQPWAHQAPANSTEKPLQLEDKLCSNVESSSSARTNVNHRPLCSRLRQEATQMESGDGGNIAQSKGIGY
jgi:hypothetical protein